ncbi:DUF2062 domain-containing protein [Natronolimnobius sp. AArcel1]|uniref:DUF2062 domain-containing protein n=1 Tax=Natronolimnobius sp. AArcel1 TaxID=1679093 RepID=UPI0013EC12A2|nr:DUF2062 domain-containing protein [Natronolimnobius sp. AArcel1]NGM71579.1 DUF2062 domain-containing protein [Natronolimnobius sp. AArcel1]
MGRERLALYRDRVRRKLQAAFREEHTPHQVGASFAIGIFITALPTGGLGIGLFFVLTSLWSWISKPALFASVAVLNPFVKPVVYVSSLQLGGLLLGTNPILTADVSAVTARIVITQLLVGNLIIAVLLAAIGYVFVRRLTRAYRQQKRQRSEPPYRWIIPDRFR